MDLPPASSATAGDAERRRKILAAVGAVVAFAAARWPRKDPDIDGRLRRAAYLWNERTKFSAGGSRGACRHTRHEWPGRLEPEQGGGSRVFYRHPPPTRGGCRLCAMKVGFEDNWNAEVCTSGTFDADAGNEWNPIYVMVGRKLASKVTVPRAISLTRPTDPVLLPRPR